MHEQYHTRSKVNDEVWKDYRDGTGHARQAIFVDGIQWQMSKQGLRRLVQFETGVTDVFISRKRRSYKPWTFAFVRVNSTEALIRVKKRLRVTNILGQPLIVEDARQPGRHRTQPEVRMRWWKKEQGGSGRPKQVWQRKNNNQRMQQKRRSSRQRQKWRRKEGQRQEWRRKEGHQGRSTSSKEVKGGTGVEVKGKETCVVNGELSKAVDNLGDSEQEARIDIEGRNFIEGTIGEGNREWLERSVIGRTTQPTDPEIIWGRLLDWQAVVQVRPIGLYKFLVICDCSDTLEMALINGIFENVFEQYERWNAEEAGDTRRVWIEGHGLPLHGWTKENMTKIGSYVGHVVKNRRQGNTVKGLRFIQNIGGYDLSESY